MIKLLSWRTVRLSVNIQVKKGKEKKERTYVGEYCGLVGEYFGDVEPGALPGEVGL